MGTPAAGSVKHVPGRAEQRGSAAGSGGRGSAEEIGRGTGEREREIEIERERETETDRQRERERCWETTLERAQMPRGSGHLAV
eukprot:8655329-Pyramimonas_sp.AAC.1